MTRLSLSGALALALFATGCSTTTVTMVDDMPDPAPTPGDMAMVSECVDGAASAEGSTFECSNVDLVAYVPLEAFDADQLNDIWGWTDPLTGTEYALVGTTNGTAFVDLSTPQFPRLVGKLPTSNELTPVWRDIKVIRDHAYIGSEAPDHGLQIFDLKKLL